MLLSCHEMMLGDLPLAEKFRQAREAGFDGIDLRGDLLRDRADEAAQLVRETGFPVPTVYARYRPHLLAGTVRERAEAVDVLRGRLADAATVGARWLIVVPVTGANQIATDRGAGGEEIEEAILLALLGELAGEAERRAVTIVLEPLNRKQTHLLTRPARAAALTRHLGARVATMVDFYHMEIEGQDFAAEIASVGDQLQLVHLAGRDRGLPGPEGTDLAPGLRALRALDYDGFHGFECNGTFALPELRESVAFVRRCAAE